MKKYLSIILLIPIALTAQQQADSLYIHQLSVEILNATDANTNLKYLTKEIGHRISGSPQMYLAEQWGKKLLYACGADEVLMQECMVPHWVRGAKEQGTVTYQENGKNVIKKLNLLSIGNAAGTGTAGVQGNIVLVHSFQELDEKRSTIKNKIVFFNVPFEDTLIETGAAYSRNVKYRGGAASASAKYGAKAVIVRSMTHAGDNIPHTGALRYNDSFPRIPAFALGLDDVSLLQDIVTKDADAKLSLFSNCSMLPDTLAHNVIGVLKGSEYPESVITIGGHLDSWDVGEGAQDDGAGIIHTIEILRAFTKLGYRPKHTIHFVLFANEENGTRGGAAYAASFKLNKMQSYFALESDAGGFTPRGFGISSTDAIFEKVLSWKSFFEPYYGERITAGGGGADIGFLNEQYNTPTAGLETDSQRYFDLHHTEKDVFENVNMRELKLGAINMAALIYLVDSKGL